MTPQTFSLAWSWLMAAPPHPYGFQARFGESTDQGRSPLDRQHGCLRWREERLAPRVDILFFTCPCGQRTDPDLFHLPVEMSLWAEFAEPAILPFRRNEAIITKRSLCVSCCLPRTAAKCPTSFQENTTELIWTSLPPCRSGKTAWRILSAILLYLPVVFSSRGL